MAADIEAHQVRFIAMLDAEFEKFGLAGRLPAGLRAAVEATPRHRFVHRYRVGDGKLMDFAKDSGEQLATIYSDTVMRHVDADGHGLASSNSQPSFILWLLHLLDLRAGHRVLEIGSGSGWLAAVMARLVGLAGHVTGIELIADLATQSRTDLAAVRVENAAILTKDGTAGHAEGAPFDRVMITAGTWDLPAVLFDQVAEGGCVLVPIELRGTGSCQVTVLRRTGRHFLAERSVPGWFVPLLGAGQVRTEAVRWTDDAVRERVTLPLETAPSRTSGATAEAFCAFLGRTEPGFAIFEAPVRGFGLVDGEGAAVWSSGQLTGYSGGQALSRMAQGFAAWTNFGLPGMAAFGLSVWRAEDAPVPAERQWVERRGETVLAWTLGADAAAWRSLT